MVEQFQAAATQLVNENFPKKTVCVIEGDLPWFTEDMRKLKRRRDRVYDRNGKSQYYHEIQNDFKTKLKHGCEKYRARIIKEINEGKRGSGYRAIRKLGEGPADVEKKNEFVIPSFVDEGLMGLQSAERLAEHFSAIN